MMYFPLLHPLVLPMLNVLVFAAASTSLVHYAQAETSPKVLPSLQVIMRAQQSYRLELKTFAAKISQLDVRLDDLKEYRHTVIKADAKQMIVKSIPKKPGQKSYTAGAFSLKADDFTQIMCESNGFSQTIAAPYLQKGTWNCGRYSHLVFSTP
jgi:Type IV pilin-like G and H, putative